MFNFHNKLESRPKKIAFLMTVPEVFTHVISNLLFLKEKGYDICLISSETKYSKVLRDKYQFRVKSIEIPRNISLFKDFWAIVNLLKFIKNENFEIVHSVTPKAGLLNAVIALFFKNIKTIHTFTGQRWETFKGFKRSIFIFIDKIIVLIIHRCLADSPSQAEYLHQIGISKKDEVISLGSGSLGGVDFTRFNSLNKENLRRDIAHKYSIQEKSIWLIFLGRINKDKGIDELIYAFKKIINEDQIETSLIFVGNDDFSENPYSNEARNEIYNNKDIHFLGFKNEVEEFLTASDILVLPSYREGFGTVVIEAAACGTPTIGTDITGLKDAIIDNKTGLLCKKQDPDDLYNKLKMLIENNNLRIQLGINAKERAFNEFNSNYISKQMDLLYQSI